MKRNQSQILPLPVGMANAYEDFQHEILALASSRCAILHSWMKLTDSIAQKVRLPTEAQALSLT